MQYHMNQTQRLFNKVSIITGAAQGIGLATAIKFAQEGAIAIVCDVQSSAVDAAVLQCQSTGATAMGWVVDVTQREMVDGMVKAVLDKFGRIDVLVNNAGLALGLEPAHQAHLEDWDTMIATNCRGLVTMTRAILPAMVERGTGLVINLGSVAGAYPYPGGNVYGATKAFVDQFTLNLRADLVGTGVRATNIAPGMCGGTEFSNVRFKGDDASAAKVYQGTVPLTATDIAETAYWIATLPPHININIIEMMPTCQGFSPFTVKRTA